jgi:DNA-binding CsgD family transcriptional regulator
MMGHLLTDNLTDDEKLTLKMLGKGQTPEEIADAMGLHRQTVYSRTRGARDKLGARTDIQAVVMALTAGIVE